MAKSPTPRGTKRHLTQPKREGANRPSRTLLGELAPVRPLAHPGAPDLNVVKPVRTRSTPPLPAVDPGSGPRTVPPPPIRGAPPANDFQDEATGAYRAQRGLSHVYDDSAENEEATQVYTLGEAPPATVPRPRADAATPIDDSPPLPLHRREPSAGVEVPIDEAPPLLLRRRRQPLSERSIPAPSLQTEPTVIVRHPAGGISSAKWAGVSLFVAACFATLGFGLRKAWPESDSVAHKEPTRASATATAHTLALSAAPAPVGQATPTQATATPEPALTPAPAGTRPATCERWLTALPPGPAQPSQAKSAWHLARKALQTGNLKTAERRLCQSVHFDSSGPGTADLIRHYFAQGDLKAATEWATWAAAEQSDNPSAQQLLADALYQQGQVEEARAVLLRAMKIDAEDSGVLRGVARRFALGGYRAIDGRDLARAKRLFGRATALDAESALGAAGMASVALRENRTKEALKWATGAVKLDANSYHGRLALGDALEASGDLDGAKRAWKAANRLNPGSKIARRRLSGR